MNDTASVSGCGSVVGSQVNPRGARRHRAQLTSRRAFELAELFATLESGEAPRGHTHGRMTAFAGPGILPRWVCSLLFALLNFIDPWRGKSFADGAGANHWFHRRGPGFGHYRVASQDGVDGHPSHWLDYNIDRNWRILRPIRGEARQLQPGLWLCRMVGATRKGHTDVLWFTLTNGSE